MRQFAPRNVLKCLLASLGVALFVLQAVSAQRFMLSALPSQDSAPSPRTKAAFHSTGSTVVLFGGLGEAGALSDTWTFNASTKIWQEVVVGEQQIRPSARYDCVSAVARVVPNNSDSYLVIVGGRNTREVLKESLVWTFHLRSRVWSQVSVEDGGTPDLIRSLSRTAACGGSSNEQTVVFSHGISADGVKSDTFELVFASSTRATIRKLYDSISSFAVGDPHPLYDAASVVTASNELVVYGGCYANGLCPNRDAWSFDIFSRQWRQIGRGLRPLNQGVMVKGMYSFKALGVDPRQSVVISKGGSNTARNFMPLEVSILDIRAKSWIHEEVDEAVLQRESHFGGMLTAIGNNKTGWSYLMLPGLHHERNGSSASQTLLLSFVRQRPRRAPQRKREIFFSRLITHAVFMFTAFGLLLPLGALGSRYIRALSGSPRWFHFHWICQAAGFLFAWIGTIFAILKESREGSTIHLHSVFGSIAMSIISVQTIAAVPCFRPGLDSGTRRTLWRRLHKLLGYTAVATGSGNILLGMILIVAPPSVWIFWCCANVAIVFLILPILEIMKRKQHSHKDDQYKEFVTERMTRNSAQQHRDSDEQSSSWISGLSTLYF